MPPYVRYRLFNVAQPALHRRLLMCPLIRMKILVVEDDLNLQRLTDALLREAGHKTVRALDATQVLSAARNEKPDLILLDIGMPGGTGTDILGRLKRNSLTSAIPVIVVTGSSDPTLRTSVEQHGANGLIQKPWLPETFVQELRNLAPHLAW